LSKCVVLNELAADKNEGRGYSPAREILRTEKVIGILNAIQNFLIGRASTQAPQTSNPSILGQTFVTPLSLFNTLTSVDKFN